jgi:hypothetical protein
MKNLMRGIFMVALVAGAVSTGAQTAPKPVDQAKAADPTMTADQVVGK